MSVTEAAQEGRLRTLEQVILDTCRRWAMLNPEKLVAFANAIKERRRHINKSSFGTVGMSSGGHFMQQGLIPVRLFRMLGRALRREGTSYNPHWLEDPTCRRIFWRVFKIGVINRSFQKDNRCRSL